MADLICPQCRAAIDNELLNRNETTACPFCGASLPSPGQTAAATGCANSDETVSDTPGPAPGSPPLPANSQVQIIESTAARLVLYIPPGGRQAVAVGLFALLWNGIVSVITALVVHSRFEPPGNQGPGGMGLFAFLSLFWGAGLFMAGFWLVLQFERTLVLLEAERVVLQKTLFRRKRLRETRLGAEAWAQLVESYKQNEQPVYRIEVPGEPRPAKFGTALMPVEQDWLIGQINAFLRRARQSDST